jgi:hypothetical protein
VLSEKDVKVLKRDAKVNVRAFDLTEAKVGVYLKPQPFRMICGNAETPVVHTTTTAEAKASF